MYLLYMCMMNVHTEYTIAVSDIIIVIHMALCV